LLRRHLGSQLIRELQKGSELLSTPSLPPPIYVFSDVLC
jgi:hypothetical protein